MTVASRADERKVLLVDDHSLVTFGLTYALDVLGVTVVSCGTDDLDEVLDVARSHRPLLALLDLQFGSDSVSGISLIAPLGAELVPSVVLTGITDPVVLGRCLEAGALGVMTKAQSFDRIVERVCGALEGRPVNSMRETEDLLAAARGARADEDRRLRAFRQLSSREAEVLAHLLDGRAAEEIAGLLFVSLATVRMHIQRILRKLDVNTQIAAVAKTRQAGWHPQKHQSC